jgi:hypothetical protein
MNYEVGDEVFDIMYGHGVILKMWTQWIDEEYIHIGILYNRYASKKHYIFTRFGGRSYHNPFLIKLHD